MSTAQPRRSTRLAPAVTLYLAAPLVAEGLLGNLPITAFLGVLALAPLYGGGALLIREVARRLGAGWPTMIALAAAYALVEEALIDQMVFTPRYLDLPSFAGYAPIPWLGASGTLVAASLTMHTVWSICVPIALVEAAATRPHEPWLRRTGTGVVLALFALAGLVYGSDQAQSNHFVARPHQFAVAAIAVLALLALALLPRVRRAHPPTPPTGSAPSPRRTALATFAVTGTYWVVWLVVPGRAGAQWPLLAGWCCWAAAALLLLRTWSRRAGWSERHRVAVAGGALVTYGWVCPIQTASLGVPLPWVLLGWAVYGGAALWLLRRAVRAVSPAQPARPGSQASLSATRS